MSPWFLLSPVICAVVGWLVNSIVSRLIFYPVKPIIFLGFRVQGFVPASKEAAIEKITRLMVKELSRSNTLAERMSSPDNLKLVMPVVESHIDHFLRHKLQTALPMIAMFVGEKTIQQLKTVFMAELELIFPEVMLTYSKQLSGNETLAGSIKEKLNSYPVEQLVADSKSILSSHILKFKWLGALSGFLIGLLQLLIFSAINSSGA